jgi:predicted adenine nucleotide alpha hydrolase (AANH) superfamily ATPase
MGSSGSGRISDYPGSSSSDASDGARGSNDSGASDRCAKAFSVRLEDVEQSEYYRVNRTTPSVGTQVRVSQRKRLVAETAQGESVGNLPTAYNYLASCMKEGWAYMGVVQSAASGPPVATLSVDFAAAPAV